MNLQTHLRILFAVTIIWAVFWVIGLPEYYQQYSLWLMIIFDTVVLVSIGFVVYWILKKYPAKRILSLSLWLAFYISIPLFIYDYLYCGIYLGYGLSFILKYWYLSVYYIIPWIICPLLGSYLINIRQRKGKSIKSWEVEEDTMFKELEQINKRPEPFNYYKRYYAGKFVIGKGPVVE